MNSTIDGAASANMARPASLGGLVACASVLNGAVLCMFWGDELLILLAAGVALLVALAATVIVVVRRSLPGHAGWTPRSATFAWVACLCLPLLLATSQFPLKLAIARWQIRQALSGLADGTLHVGGDRDEMGGDYVNGTDVIADNDEGGNPTYRVRLNAGSFFIDPGWCLAKHGADRLSFDVPSTSWLGAPSSRDEVELGNGWSLVYEEF